MVVALEPPKSGACGARLVTPNVARAALMAGVFMVIVATQRVLEGLVGMVKAVRVAPFVATVVGDGG